MNRIFVDRSRIVQDWRCPRSRYWTYEHGGIGLVPQTRAPYFDFGTAIHEALASLLSGGDLDEIVERGKIFLMENLAEDDPHKMEEHKALFEGLVRGWERWGREPLMTWYDVVAAEVEVELTLAPSIEGCAEGVVMACKPDLLLRRKEDDTHWYVEWKTTGSLGERWFPQWNHAIQLHAGCLAVKETLGIDVDGVIVQGLYKGYQRDGLSTSIFCYGYQKGLQALYKWSPGSTKCPTWQLPGGVKGWVAAMPPEILADQFAQAPPVFLRKDLIADWIAQTVQRERWIASARGRTDQALLNTVFPQHFDQCAPQMGSPCPDVGLCFNPVAAEDPLRHGFQWRTPHHDGDPAWIRLKEIRES